MSSRQVPSYRKGTVPRFASTAVVTQPPTHAAFEVLRHTQISEYNATATHYRHRETGAEVVSVCSTEVEKVFGIAFRTPVSDSRGVPHIIEHSVLCGSRKYPVKEPFVELLKSSLQTYLNAMTYPDRTVRTKCGGGVCVSFTYAALLPGVPSGFAQPQGLLPPRRRLPRRDAAAASRALGACTGGPAVLGLHGAAAKDATFWPCRRAGT